MFLLFSSVDRITLDTLSNEPSSLRARTCVVTWTIASQVERSFENRTKHSFIPLIIWLYYLIILCVVKFACFYFCPLRFLPQKFYLFSYSVYNAQFLDSMNESVQHCLTFGLSVHETGSYINRTHSVCCTALPHHYLWSCRLFSKSWMVKVQGWNLKSNMVKLTAKNGKQSRSGCCHWRRKSRTPCCGI